MKNILLIFAVLVSTVSVAQVGIGTQNPQGVFNIDGAKDNATSGAPTASQQVDDFVVTSTGRVGIGTTSPANKLQVNGNALFAPTTTNDGISGSPITVEIYGKAPTGTATQVGGVKMGWFNSFGGIEVLRGASVLGMGLGFNIASEATGTTSEAMRITSDGNVGIGTTAPSQKLDVAGAVKFSGALMPNNIAGTTGQVLTSAGTATAPTWTTLTTANTPNIYSADGTLAGNRTVTQGANNLTFSSTTGNLIFNPSSSGKVGIGNTNPSSPLVVQGVTGNGVLKLIAPSVAAGDNWWLGFGHGTTSTDANDRARIGVNILGGGHGRLFFTTGAAGSQLNAMFIDESQRVGIGTTAPISKLDVNGTVGAAVRTSSVSTTTSNDFTVLMTTSGTSVTLEAPTSVARRIMAIKNTSSGTVSVVGNIDGNSSTTFILLSKEAIEIQSDGTTWQIIAKYASPVPLAVSTQLNPVSIPSGVNTLLTSYTNVSDASNGAWNASTGIFTCNKAGLYRFEIRVMFSLNTWTQGNEVNAQFIRNGVEANSASWFAASTYNQYAFSGHNVLTINLAVGDTIQARIWHNAPGARTTYTAQFSNFSISEIR